jgi:hypothetical protein
VGNLHRLTYNDLVGLFRQRSIDFSAPGFYNSERFLREEARDPEFLELYARFVQLRPQTSDELQRVRAVLPKVVELVHHEIVAEGLFGLCIDVAAAMLKMLERLGLWSFAVRGTFRVRDVLDKALIAQFLMTDFRPPVGHYWLVVPPFKIVDVTVHEQNYTPMLRDRVQQTLLLERLDSYVPTAVDVAPPSLRRDAEQQIRTRLIEFWRTFKPGLSQINGVLYTYVPGGVTAPHEQLEEVGRTLSGRSMIRVFDEIVQPAIS